MTPEDFCAVADPLPEPMLLLSSGGRVVTGNQAVQDRLGVSARELKGRLLADVVTETPAEVARYLRVCSRNRHIVLGSLTIDRAGGGIPCRAEGALVRGKTGTSDMLLLLRLIPKSSAIGQFVALNQRIADLRREIERRRVAEEAARRQEQRLRVTLDSIGDGVVVTDPEGRVSLLNPVAESLTGWVLQEAQGRPLPEVFHIVNEVTRQPVDNPAVRALHEGVVVGLANGTILIARDGVERPIDDSAAPIRGGERVEGAVLVFRDITRRRQIEAALRDVNQRKDEFLALLAHELRNPLAPLRNGLEVLRVATDPAAVERTRGMMERQLAHLVRLVDDLVDVSRITMHRLELRTERIALADVLESALEMCDAALRRQGQSLHTTIPAEPILVEGDPTRLIQAFGNVLGNAIRFTDRGGTIQVELEREGSDAVVIVSDTGVGIPDAMLTRVFDMFTQVDPSLERVHGGLGIGLAITRRLIEMHGGTIEARSEGPGRGSEFVFRLPAVPAVQRAPADATGPGVERGGRRRVLVADDNLDAAHSLAMVLELAGHEVRLAADGVQAVEVAAAFRPDLVLLDIGMPKMNGYEACRRIREQAGAQAPMVVALSGWGREEHTDRSGAAGFDHHFLKPVEPARLEDLLASLPSVARRPSGSP